MGFSADWLALREPADHAARDVGLLRQAAQAAGSDPVVLDLGCGSGSTVRALAPHLPKGARWRLVDNDAALLEIAAAGLGDQAQTQCCDLSELDKLPLEGVTLVTASALLDLVPVSWVYALAVRLNVPFYAALSYDGQMQWTPDDPQDAAITDAFNRHQIGDKGLGPALGPRSVDTSVAVFAQTGFDVVQADSAWMLGPDQAPLQAMLVEGIAQAAAEAGVPDAADWGARRLAAADRTRCRIGHGDFLARPRIARLEAPNARD